MEKDWIMKNLLIIYPHWVPSNLAGVHRPRLLANFLSKFGWHPIVLTVKSEYYEEPLDPDIHRTVASDIEVHYVDARPVGKRMRVIGDIGLRAWPFIKKRALELIDEKQPHFIWIPIPSFYMALMGRVLHEKSGVPYGIDYIDPWVRDISNRRNLRSITSLWLASLLEPYAVSRASLISGVSQAYYQPVLIRNFNKRPVHQLAFPYGFDPKDHQIVLENLPMPWSESVTKPLIYAGAFLPNAHLFIEALFKSIAALRKAHEIDPGCKLYFIGTGAYTGKSIQEYAKENGIGDLVIENRDRKPFLHILNYLQQAYGVMLIGSTEAHYTASKTFQSLLSGKPVFSMLHETSSAAAIMEEAQADSYLVRWNETMTEEKFIDNIQQRFREFLESGHNWKIDRKALEPYSAEQNARKFSETLNSILA
jgi:hypothetical protein